MHTGNNRLDYLNQGINDEENTSDTSSPDDSQLVLNPITHESSFATKAYEHIKAAIIVGDIVPGKLYSVNQFATALGVSRTPVREALLMLAQEGMLVMERNRGFRMGTITVEELNEIVQLREFLEVPAMELLAALKPAPLQAFTEARTIYTDLQAAADKPDLLEFLRLDRLFHLTLLSALGNNRLTTLVGDLRDRMYLPGLRALANGGQLHQSGQEHMALLIALENGDVEESGNIMLRHLKRTQSEWH